MIGRYNGEVSIAAPFLSNLKTETASLKLFRWWHLLSLDAPTVAAVWACLFARIMHLHLPWIAPLMLALGTWLIYIADRLLDGAVPDESGLLRERHHFYARHRKHFLLAGLGGSAVLLSLIVTSMYVITRRDDTVVFGAAVVYFGVVHGPRKWVRKRGEEYVGNKARLLNNNLFRTKAWLPKEAAVGILFAAATAVPAWSRLDGSWAGQRWELILAVVIFAILCWLNCVAIEHWETAQSSRTFHVHTHATTEWAGRNLANIALGIAGTALYLSAISLVLPRLASLASAFLSAALSAIALFALDRLQGDLSPMQLRVGADAALLTPLLFLAAWHLPLYR